MGRNTNMRGCNQCYCDSLCLVFFQQIFHAVTAEDDDNRMLRCTARAVIDDRLIRHHQSRK